MPPTSSEDFRNISNTFGQAPPVLELWKLTTDRLVISVANALIAYKGELSIAQKRPFGWGDEDSKQVWLIAQSIVNQRPTLDES